MPAFNAWQVFNKCCLKRCIPLGVACSFRYACVMAQEKAVSLPFYLILCFRHAMPTAIERRLSEWTLTAVWQGEGLQVLRYKKDQKYDAVRAPAPFACHCISAHGLGLVWHFGSCHRTVGSLSMTQ